MPITSTNVAATASADRPVKLTPDMVLCEKDEAIHRDGLS